jgi:hypothetical protein
VNRFSWMVVRVGLGTAFFGLLLLFTYLSHCVYNLPKLEMNFITGTIDYLAFGCGIAALCPLERWFVKSENNSSGSQRGGKETPVRLWWE